METVRPRGTDKAEVIQVIKTTSILGKGTEKDPVRHIYQYWDFEGNLIASHDTLEDGMMNFSKEEIPQHEFPLLNCQEYQRIYKEVQQEVPKED